VLLLASAFIDYHFITKFYLILYGVNLALLVVVLILPADSLGVHRWLGIGSFGIQSSEFCKLFMILFMAKLLEKREETLNRPLTILLFLGALVLPLVLIMIEPSFAFTVVLFTGIVMLFAAGLNYHYLLGALVVAVPVVGFTLFDVQRPQPLLQSIGILKGYQVTKILNFLHPSAASLTYDQTSQSIAAIASGMQNGKGLYNGTINQLNYLAESHNDFIFSVIGEELGFVGCVAALALILVIILKCVRTAQKACDKQGQLIAVGVAAMLAYQVFVNVSVVSGLLPNTGMPFPFLSAGGSSLWVCMIGVGLVINVGMSKQKSMFDNNS